MNIAGGQSTATPYWQTEDLRFGIVTADVSHKGECTVRLSCGNQVRAAISPNVDAPRGSGVRICRTAEGWCIERVLR